MTEDQADKLGFREWTSHYEKEQEADREKLNSVVESVGILSGIVNRMSASVEALTDNQKGMFTRLNRPWQWGVVMAGFMAMFSMAAMFGTMATLIVGPIHDNMEHQAELHQADVERNLELHMWFRETIAHLERENASSVKDREWLRLMEQRMNERLHRSIQ